MQCCTIANHFHSPCYVSSLILPVCTVLLLLAIWHLRWNMQSNPNNLIGYVGLREMTIPNSEYNIIDTNNTLVINVAPYILPEDNYRANWLASVGIPLQQQLHRSVSFLELLDESNKTNVEEHQFLVQSLFKGGVCMHFPTIFFLPLILGQQSFCFTLSVSNIQIFLTVCY